MPTQTWYAALAKPAWAPPAWLFSPVWTVLYAIIAFSFGYVFYQVLRSRLPTWLLWPFGLNLLFNFAFTPIQFGLKSNLLASLDILLVLFTLGWAMYAVHPYAAWVAYVNIPHFLWVLFATGLQLSITYLNL